MSLWHSTFAAYGACFGVETNRPDCLAPVLERLPLQPAASAARSTAVFRLEYDDAGAPSRLHVNSAAPSDDVPAEAPLHWQLESLITLHIARNSPCVFVHAGFVSHRGRGILFPGRSFAGKTTLTAALLAQGAAYYSDDFAVITPNGSVLPWHCPLRIRTPAGRVDATPADFGTTAAHAPVMPALVVSTEFRPGVTWLPRAVSPGEALLRMLEHAVAARTAPERVCRVLSGVARNAVCLTGPRGDADDTARRILEYCESLSPVSSPASHCHQVQTCCH